MAKLQNETSEYIDVLELRCYVLEVQAAMMGALASLENRIKGFDTLTPVDLNLSAKLAEVEEYVMLWKPKIGPETVASDL